MKRTHIIAFIACMFYVSACASADEGSASGSADAQHGAPFSYRVEGENKRLILRGPALITDVTIDSSSLATHGIRFAGFSGRPHVNVFVAHDDATNDPCAQVGNPFDLHNPALVYPLPTVVQTQAAGDAAFTDTPTTVTNIAAHQLPVKRGEVLCVHEAHHKRNGVTHAVTFNVSGLLGSDLDDELAPLRVVVDSGQARCQQIEALVNLDFVIETVYVAEPAWRYTATNQALLMRVARTSPDPALDPCKGIPGTFMTWCSPIGNDSNASHAGQLFARLNFMGGSRGANDAYNPVLNEHFVVARNQALCLLDTIDEGRFNPADPKSIVLIGRAANFKLDSRAL